MANETLALKNVNMLSRANYDTVEDPVKEELWAVETETYSDDDGNWYRVYPDGWCEQGGRGAVGTVTLLKPFRDTNYTVAIAPFSSTHAYISATNTTSFTLAGAGVRWSARGYIA